MSVPPRCRLPERPSLEQLRKQAKEHLDTLRAGDPSVNLAAAQHALAREYGFDSWPKLVHHVETVQPANRMLQPAELKSDQKLLWSQGRGTDVWTLIQACASGDFKAVRALIAEDPSLARSHYDYRKPLYFAVRENRIDVVRFLLVALLLSIVGIYGVITYVVAQRTREVGIRMALGAQIGDVRSMFLRHGLGSTGAGILIGVAIALALPG